MDDPRLLLALALASAVTYLWRGLGVAIGGRINPEGPVFRWFTCVAYAMLAALISRMILLPVGMLQTAPLSDRLIALAAALAVFFVTRRTLPAGILTGIGIFALLTWLRGF